MNVRKGYTEECIWRKSLGNKELLYCFSLHGYSLDAPEHMPAGSTRSYTHGKDVCVENTTWQRPGFFG